MPEMDGIEATIAIRNNPRYRNLPIVAMTASVMQGDRDRCLQAGMNDHVGKPIDPDELWQALLQWIKPRAASNQPTPPVSPQANRADVPVIPTAIPGLNTTEGLRRVLGKQPLYLSMLRKFATGQKTVIDQIGQALDAGDGAQAERLAHTLRGVAGNIGAIAIQAAATTLETAIRNGHPRAEIDGWLATVRRPLMALIEQLELKLPPETIAARVVIDPVKLAEVCNRLAALLADNDAEAADLLHDHTDLLRNAFPQHYTTIATEVESFDFEAAHMALLTARDTLKSDKNH